MASNKVVRLGPVALGTAVANVFNPPNLTGGVNIAAGTNCYYILRHIRAVNKVSTAVNISAYIGTTGNSDAGKEFAWNSNSVPANSYVDWFGVLRLDTADFMTASATSATAVTIEAEGEIGVS